MNLNGRDRIFSFWQTNQRICFRNVKNSPNDFDKSLASLVSFKDEQIDDESK